jgi:hypothetical protein
MRKALPVGRTVGVSAQRRVATTWVIFERPGLVSWSCARRQRRCESWSAGVEDGVVLRYVGMHR